MSDALRTAIAAADDYLTFLAGYRHGDGGPADLDTLADSPQSGRMVDATRGQSGQLKEAVMVRLCEGLARLPDPFAAAVVAIQMGSMVENGFDPEPLGEALRSRLADDYAAARRFVEALEAETGLERPDDADAETLARIGRRERTGASAWAGLKYSTPAAMAAWCRHRPTRLAAKSVPGLTAAAAYLGDRGGYCHYVAELLASADGTRLTILVAEQRKGFEVELEAVRNAAHLFALLEDALVGDPAAGLLSGPRTDPQVAAIARGEAAAINGMTFDIGWHYEYWWGLKPAAAARANGMHPLVAAMIGAEAAVDRLPAVDGRAVVIMSPGRLGQRTCDISFFAPLHDALRSGVIVLRQLTADEVDALTQSLTAEADTLDGGSAAVGVADAVGRLAAAVGARHEFSEDDLFRTLDQAGVPRASADRAVKFTQTAWAREILAGMGIQFDADFFWFDAAGEVVESGTLAADPYYAEAVRLAPRYAGAPGFVRFAMMSADLQSVNTALHAGSKPEDLVVGPAAYFTEQPTDAGLERVHRFQAERAKATARPERPQ